MDLEVERLKADIEKIEYQEQKQSKITSTFQGLKTSESFNKRDKLVRFKNDCLAYFGFGRLEDEHNRPHQTACWIR